LTTDLEGRVALVTGASRGLGRAVAVALAEHGGRPVLTARGHEGLEKTARLVTERTGIDCQVIAADVGSVTDVEGLHQQTLATSGSPSILVNAAGVYGPLGPVLETDPRQWIDTMMINTVGPYLTSRLFVPAMVNSGWGRVVNVSSSASLYPPTSLDSAYATSKTALNRLTRHLAAEIAGTGVTANVLHPGSLKTEMWSDIVAQLAPIRERERAHALREWADDVDRTGGDPMSAAVDLILQLLQPDSSINGQFCWPAGITEQPVPSW
jgi:NAD(P)-dependent dehydrogenase (short-subunit alcohol dehydrogenase family)